MAYRVDIKYSAEKELKKISPKLYERVLQIMLSLENEPRPRGCKKLRSVELYRIRSGNYRILYTIDDSLQRIEIIGISHRKDAYRDM